jgi:hypothetical protein
MIIIYYISTDNCKECMKTINIFVLLIFIVSSYAAFAQNSDWETYEVLNRLLTLQVPGMPVIQDNSVIFTADSSIRRVGVAFAHEDFSNVYWFRQLMVSQDFRNPVLLPGERFPSPHRDSGIQFHIYEVPEHLRELEYRLVINGLWTTDPVNPEIRRDPVTGLTLSVLRLPQRQLRPNPLRTLPEGLNFTFRAPPGETVTVAGCFNGWDPFMYELREGPAGIYSLLIPLPSGTYQYMFFHRGERFVDPYNPRRIYARDGSAASLIVVP